MSFVSSESAPDLTAKALWRKEHGELSMAVGAAAVTWWEAVGRDSFIPTDEDDWTEGIAPGEWTNAHYDRWINELYARIGHYDHLYDGHAFGELRGCIRRLAEHAEAQPVQAPTMTTDERMAKQRERQERERRQQEALEAQARAYREAEEEAENVELIEEVKRRGLLSRIMKDA